MRMGRINERKEICHPLSHDNLYCDSEPKHINL
jgi:hypothetical protein